MSRQYLTAATYRELAAKLTGRDLTLIKRVSDLRFVTGSQLTRLHFAGSHDPAVNARAARRALLRLTRLNVLARLPRSVGGVRSGSAGFVYYLGIGGQRVAVEHGWQPERRWRRSLTPGSLFLHHTLQVSELHTLLIEGDRSRRFELLELSAEPSCHRIHDGYGSQRLVLKPDSYVRLGLGQYEYSSFVEIDRGTEGSRALSGQLRRYVAYHRSGVEQAKRSVFPKVFWLTTTAERVRVIEGCVQQLPRDTRGLFAVAQFDQALAVMLEQL